MTRKLHSFARLKAENPKKFVFSLRIAGPAKSGQTGRTVIQGLLPAQDEIEVETFVREFNTLLLSSKRLSKRKPPKGMVRIEKKKRVAGEESE